MTLWLGDLEEDSIVSIPFTTHEAAGGNVAPSSALEIADIRVYKNASATQRSSAAGMSMVSPFDSLTGVHMVEIDCSDNTDAGFWAAGNQYHVILAPDETVDGQTITGVHLGSFGIVYGAAAKLGTSVATILSRIGTPSNLGGGADLANNLSNVYDVADAIDSTIGAAGAGLTAIPLAAAAATAAELAKVPKSDSTVTWNATALASINAQADLALSDYDPPTKAEMDAAHALLATPAQVNAEVVDVIRTDTIPDSYATDGAQPTIAQAILAIQQFLQERAVSGTTVTVKKPDGSTTAMTFTLSDATNPASITRAS